MMKNKDYSKWLKLLLIVVAYGLSVLKWLNVLPNATITEIWGCAAAAYGIALGTMDFNIVADSLKGR